MSNRARKKRRYAVSYQTRSNRELGRTSRAAQDAGTRVNDVFGLTPAIGNSHSETPDRFPTCNTDWPATTFSPAARTSHFETSNDSLDEFSSPTQTPPQPAVRSIRRSQPEMT